MKLIIFFKRILSVITVIGLFVFLGLVFHFVFQDEVEGDLAQITAKATAFYEQKQTDLVGFPIRLKIPSINLDAAVEYVGLTSKGALDTPKGSANVAWFDQGPRPGEIGNSIIDGHFGYKNNKPAVFDNLYRLKKGNKIYIEDSKGKIITFVVQELKIYDRNQEASDVFISNDEKSHLNLITCEGTWNVIDKTHSNRLVIFADKE